MKEPTVYYKTMAKNRRSCQLEVCRNGPRFWFGERLSRTAIGAVGVAMAIPGKGVSSVETHASVTDGTLADGWQPDKAQNEATDQATNMGRIVDWAEEANGNVQHNKAQGVA